MKSIKKCESVRRKSFWHLRLGKHELTRSHFTYSSIICSIVSKLFQLSKRFHLQIKQTFASTISFTDRQQRLGCCVQCLSYFQSTLGSRFRFNVHFLFCVCFSIRLQPRIRCDVFWSRVVADLVNYSVLKRCLHWKRPRQVLSLSVGNRHMLAWDQNFAGKFNWKWENWRNLQKCFLIAFDVLCNLKFQSEEVFYGVQSWTSALVYVIRGTCVLVLCNNLRAEQRARLFGMNQTYEWNSNTEKSSSTAVVVVQRECVALIANRSNVDDKWHWARLVSAISWVDFLWACATSRNLIRLKSSTLQLPPNLTASTASTRLPPTEYSFSFTKDLGVTQAGNLSCFAIFAFHIADAISREKNIFGRRFITFLVLRQLLPFLG